MKRNAIIRIIIWSIVILLLLGILAAVLLGVFAFRSFHTVKNDTQILVEKPRIMNEVAPLQKLPTETTLRLAADAVQNIEIEWVAGSILIQPADVEEIEISESDTSDPKYAMQWQNRNGKLTIQFCENTRTDFGFGMNIHAELSKDLTIYVPRNWECNTLEIDAASASVEVNDLIIREVEFDGASGVCIFNNCTVDKIDLDTASGDVNYVGSLNILDFDAASASVYAVLSNVPTRVDMDSMSGDLDLTLPADAGFTVSMDALSSDFTSDFETIMKNDNYISGDGSCRINVDAMSGDVIIRKGE